MTTLMISNKDMDNIMKTFKYFEKFGLLIKNIIEAKRWIS